MRIRKRWMIVAVVGIIGILMVFGLRARFGRSFSESTVAPSVVTPSITWKEYSSSTISFKYPATYVLQEVPSISGSSITLTPESEIREASSSVPGDAMPPSIRIDSYPASGQSDAFQWVKETRVSNFSQSDGLTASTTIAGAPGVIYRWSGLLSADEAVVLHNKKVYAFTVSYLDAADPIRTDFGRILGTVSF